MVVGGALRTIGCASCRSYLLRTFTSIAGRPAGPQLHPIRRVPPISISSTGRFSSHLTNERHDETNHEVDEAQETVEETAGANEETVAVSTLPWYLQVNTPQRAPQPLSDRQNIPDLPEHPPPILQPLLQQLSIDLGLDGLSVLDLRKLDPPPALGANLIMLLGTARSEKHLHVSADRLCRWLRSTYKLRPDADGLLGRNEIKLKLRRKSRRAKLIGSTPEDGGDDGIRTGWVCVDVGVVDGPEGVLEATPTPKAFVGFGERTDGVRIVVQMLTEEKREEIDLEKLWGGILRRSIQALQPELEGGKTELPVPATPIPSAPEATPQVKFSTVPAQSRGFHSSARQHTQVQGQSPVTTPSPSEDISSSNTSPQLDLTRLQELVTRALKSDGVENMDIELNGYTSQFRAEEWKPVVLRQLQGYLRGLPKDEAVLVLGKGSFDSSSTPFLVCYHQTISGLPGEVDGDAAIWLYCYARLGAEHNGYGLSGLMELFRTIQEYGSDVSTESYILLLNGLLRPAHDDPGKSQYVAAKLSKENMAVHVLRAMHDRGKDFLTEEILVTLQELATLSDRTNEVEHGSAYTSPQTTFDLPTVRLSPLQWRIHNLIETATLTCLSDASRLRLLALYSSQNNFAEFWDIFSMAPRRWEHQSANIYTFMFSRVAKTRHQRGNINVLRTWVPEVEQRYQSDAPEQQFREIEPHLVEAVQSCLKVVDPFVEENARDLKANDEWVSMWRRFSPPT